MLTLKKVAITGGLSSGKSTVCKFLKERGAYVVSSDEIVHRILTPHSKTGQEVIALLGKEITVGDQFDRAKIAKKVFKNKQTLKALEQILHPAVLEEIERQYNQVKNQTQYPLFVAEVPLLYESESQHLFHATIAVVANPQIAQKRFQEKTHYPMEEFEMRMTHQLPLEEKMAKADYVVFNNGDLIELEKQVETLYLNLTQ